MPLVLDALVPLLGVVRVVGQHMVLAPVLSQSGADATSDGAAIDDDADLFVGYSPEVVDLGWVEFHESEFGTSAIPPVNDRLRNCSVHEPLEPGSSPTADSGECRVGRRADRHMVGMTGDAVRAEGGHDGWLFLDENAFDLCDDLVEWQGRQPAVRQSKPLVPVRHPAERAPRRLVLGLANRRQGLARGGEAVPDIPQFPMGRVHQDEPEVGVLCMERDASGNGMSVVVGVRYHAHEGPVVRHVTHYEICSNRDTMIPSGPRT